MDVRLPAIALRHLDAAIALNESAMRLDNDQLRRTDMINRSDQALALTTPGRHQEALLACEYVLATERTCAAAGPLDASRTRDLWEQQQDFAAIALDAGKTDTARAPGRHCCRRCCAHDSAAH